MISRPVNIASIQDFAIRQTYLKLYPFIKRDFMGRTDCQMVHAPGNIVAPTSGGPVAHTVFQGGHSTVADSLEAQYKTMEETGDIRVETALRTGEGLG